jgi:5-methylthioribose kinase
VLPYLSPSDVGAYLVARGVVGDSGELEATELGGGVSNVVLAVRADGLRIVVKQALPRLRVAEEWLAPRERAITEADALRLMGRVAPGSVPPVLDADPERCVLAIAEAPESWRNWKSVLLAGEADPAVATRLGDVLSRLHTATAEVDPGIGGPEAFEALRVEPYLRTIMSRHPKLAPEIEVYVERMLAARRCLVHGDYSPKNVLVGVRELWVLDWEVAHRGDPAFDLAFLLNHLLLKAIHRPGSRPGYRACAEAFVGAYVRGVPYDLVPETEYLLGLTGCLMLARVDGKSPAEYLSEEERERARAAGIALLTDPPGSLSRAWSEIAG